MGQPFAHIAVGDVLFAQKEFAAAAPHYRMALQLAEELDLPLARLWALVTWGDYEAELGRPERARWYYERALSLTPAPSSITENFTCSGCRRRAIRP